MTAEQELTEFLKKYEVLRELGRGAMGTVLLARDKRLDRLVALKKIRASDTAAQSDATAPHVFERFYREAKVIARLNHPNIVGIHDIFLSENALDRSKGVPDEDRIICLALEYIDGPSLKDLCAQRESGQFDEAEALRITIDIADALAWAHEKNIIHRDIKPANAMVEKSRNRVVLLDFGLSHIFSAEQEETLTQDQQVMGTPAYMSPEQILTPRNVDHRTDVYSLGLTLYSMLTGTLPYSEESLFKLCEKQVNEPPILIRSINPRVSEFTERAVGMAIRKNPQDRVQTAAQARDLLKGLLDVLETSRHSHQRPDPQRLQSLFRTASPNPDDEHPDAPPFDITPADFLAPVVDEGGSGDRMASTLIDAQPGHEPGDIDNLETVIQQPPPATRDEDAAPDPGAHATAGPPKPEHNPSSEETADNLGISPHPARGENWGANGSSPAWHTDEGQGQSPEAPHDKRSHRVAVWLAVSAILLAAAVALPFWLRHQSMEAARASYESLMAMHSSSQPSTIAAAQARVQAWNDFLSIHGDKGYFVEDAERYLQTARQNLAELQKTQDRFDELLLRDEQTPPASQQEALDRARAWADFLDNYRRIESLAAEARKQREWNQGTARAFEQQAATAAEQSARARFEQLRQTEPDLDKLLAGQDNAAHDEALETVRKRIGDWEAYVHEHGATTQWADAATSRLTELRDTEIALLAKAQVQENRLREARQEYENLESTDAKTHAETPQDAETRMNAWERYLEKFGAEAWHAGDARGNLSAWRDRRDALRDERRDGARSAFEALDGREPATVSEAEGLVAEWQAYLREYADAEYRLADARRQLTEAAAAADRLAERPTSTPRPAIEQPPLLPTSTPPVPTATATPKPASQTAMASLETVAIPGGEIEMGYAGEPEERPVTTVQVSPFRMARYETTWGQWRAIMGDTPHSEGKPANHPVENVSWDQAMEFCRKLSEEKGVTYLLPTEAQWECACRAGSSERFHFGSELDDLEKYAWFRDNSGQESHPVGQKQPNAFGLHDMYGNVWEWCLSAYRPYPYDDDDGRNDPTASGDRVIRGRGYADQPTYFRSAARRRQAPGSARSGVGFRVCVPGD